LHKAAQVLAKNIFYNQGQICSAPSRAIVDNEIKEEFVKLLIEESQNYIPQDPFHIETEVGCIVSKEQQQRVLDYIEKGKNAGAKIITPCDVDLKHLCVLPTIFDQVDPESSIAKEEIFGPVLVIIGVSSMREAISIANNSKYGLAASIWTNDLDEAHQVSRELQAGIVHVNSYGDDDDTVPFGGIKESGIGKDKSLYAFDEYSYVKTIWVHLNK
jgi:acyl-CoA reductase-like NAD-dependent aldehyde dehydrogenase